MRIDMYDKLNKEWSVHAARSVLTEKAVQERPAQLGM